ncbi:MAG: hypothetical protein O7D34_01945, partial [Ignavibacteria bacterium]|nr:hypothetical protein [Ignavibacteria bacterium]
LSPLKKNRFSVIIPNNKNFIPISIAIKPESRTSIELCKLVPIDSVEMVNRPPNRYDVLWTAL